MAQSFLKFCKVETQRDSSIKLVAGALSSLSQAVLEREGNSKQSASRSPSTREISSVQQKSQNSVGNDSDDTQPMEDVVPMITSSPPTPPLESSEPYNITSPEYQTLLSQLRALISPCLTYMFPNSSLKKDKFLVDFPKSGLVWALRPLSSSESSTRSQKIPTFPQELTNELLSIIKSQMVKRTSSAIISPSASPSRPRLGDFEQNRTKTLSSIKHGAASPTDLEEYGSPSKRFKAANGSSVPSAFSNEAAHMRILQLETEQDNMRREIAVLRAEIEQLKKPRNVLSS